MSRLTKEELFQAISAELERAQSKFPGDDLTFVAMIEEAGEVAKACLDEPRENVIKESIQLAVMACRLILDGDSSINSFRNIKGLDLI